MRRPPDELSNLPSEVLSAEPPWQTGEPSMAAISPDSPRASCQTTGRFRVLTSAPIGYNPREPQHEDPYANDTDVTRVFLIIRTASRSMRAWRVVRSVSR